MVWIQHLWRIKPLSSITTSVKSTEFTLNIPSEYDYHYNANSESFHYKIIFEISITNVKRNEISHATNTHKIL